jgi:hypothetical protein
MKRISRPTARGGAAERRKAASLVMIPRQASPPGGEDLLQTHHRGAQDKYEQSTERAVKNVERAVHH